MKDYLLISDAAKEVCVESHVLRYWEEELSLPIKRNELGHRYYVAEDIERFKRIKDLKDRGLQLRAIRMLMTSGRLETMGDIWTVKKEGAATDEETVLEGEGFKTEEDVAREEEGTAPDKREQGMGIEILEVRELEVAKPQSQAELHGMAKLQGQAELHGMSRMQGQAEESPQERAGKLQWLLCGMIRETVRENNRELCETIRDSIVKELDEQFRMQEEREEKRRIDDRERGEEYYRRVDELLRKKLSALEKEGEAKRAKKKRHFIF